MKLLVLAVFLSLATTAVIAQEKQPVSEKQQLLERIDSLESQIAKLLAADKTKIDRIASLESKLAASTPKVPLKDTYRKFCKAQKTTYQGFIVIENKTYPICK